MQISSAILFSKFFHRIASLQWKTGSHRGVNFASLTFAACAKKNFCSQLHCKLWLCKEAFHVFQVRNQHPPARNFLLFFESTFRFCWLCSFSLRFSSFSSWNCGFSATQNFFPLATNFCHWELYTVGKKIVEREAQKLLVCFLLRANLYVCGIVQLSEAKVRLFVCILLGLERGSPPRGELFHLLPPSSLLKECKSSLARLLLHHCSPATKKILTKRGGESE